jgi:hypothetical protein
VSRRKGETASRNTQKTDIHTKQPNSLVGPKAAKSSRQKKAPKAKTSGALEQQSSTLNDAHA